MSLERVYKTEVVTVAPQATLLEVARLMRTHHVGSVIVVEEHCPVGIVTDRDIVVKVVAAELDPTAVQAKDLTVAPPSLVNINYDPLDVATIMRARGVRRLPVVDERRHLLGVITLDDMLELLGKEISGLAEVIHTELAKESATTIASR
jgi:CBS domain-containing protein